MYTNSLLKCHISTSQFTTNQRQSKSGYSANKCLTRHYYHNFNIYTNTCVCFHSFKKESDAMSLFTYEYEYK